MKKFLTALLCICMVVTMMPYMGDSGFMANADDYWDYMVRPTEMAGALGVATSTDGTDYYVSLCNFAGDLCMLSLGIPVNANVIVNVEGYNYLYFCDSDTEYSVKLTGSGIIKINDSYPNIKFNKFVIDGPSVIDAGEVSAPYITVENGELYAKKVSSTVNYTQNGGYVEVDYLGWASNPNNYKSDVSSGYAGFKTGGPAAMDLKELVLNGGRLRA